MLVIVAFFLNLSVARGGERLAMVIGNSTYVTLH